MAASRAIQALETDFGVTLFERDHHKVALTPPGAALVREAETLLARAAAARRRIQAASRPTSTLTVGFRRGIIITDVVQQFTREHPETEVNAIRIEWDEQHAAVADGRVDIAWIRTPIAGAGLVVAPLSDDPEVVALPAAHRLTGRDSVSLADLASEPMLRYDTAPGHEAGHPSAKRGIRTMEEKLEAVALGHGLALVPATAAAYYQRPDIAYRPVPGAPPYQAAHAATTDTAQRSEAQAFIRTALAVSERNAANRGRVLLRQADGQRADAPNRRRAAGPVPLAGVVFPGGEPVVPGQQPRRRHREDLRPAPPQATVNQPTNGVRVGDVIAPVSWPPRSVNATLPPAGPAGGSNRAGLCWPA